MSQMHHIKMSPKTYPGGLRIFECDQCRYAFAAEINGREVIDFDSRIPINHGDVKATHAFFKSPRIELSGGFSAEISQ